ncbi:glycosyltransferase family 2 protein [Gorillibacterium sp. sgz500922]|uniref:glycosyltransferase family 2 protein n=1 Tax=Gorillibacterium sp. sgz500922 TaxID=3446694 RepID=UPI003F68154C
MPVYKQKPEYLKAAIDSVLNQTFPAFKLIVVIDGAPEMEALVRLYARNDPRVEVLLLESNRGVANALNRGFQILMKSNRMEYLTWVSSDNIYYPFFFETLRKALLKGPDELGLVYSSFRSIDDAGRALHDEAALAAQRNYQAQPKEKLLDSSIIGVSFMYKAKYARMIDGYGMVPVEDYDYWLRLTEHCEIKFIPVELMEYRVNSAFSVSASLQSTQQHRQWRYKFHLVRHQARMRRRIDPLLTVLVPLENADESTERRIECLYEQAFSNYQCSILDLTEDRRVTERLSAISHPATEFVWFPGVRERSALLYAVQLLRTPHTMILGPKPMTDVMELEILMELLAKADPAVLSNFFTDDHSEIQYRYTGGYPERSTLYNELFRTQALLQLVKNRYAEE